jgi:hypothetical protein
MQKTSVLFVFVVLILLSAGCNTTNKNQVGSSGSQKPVQDKIIIIKLEKDTTIQKYELQTHKDEITNIEDSAIVKKFTDAFMDAEKIIGNVNVITPNYEVIIHKDGSESAYYLWININDQTQTSNALYMNNGDTNTLYKISVENTNSIIKLLNEMEK